jgi:SAM-dependent methyltransferase
LSWYEAAFRSEYLRVYRHRDDESAAREVAFLLDVTEIRSGDRVLDLACGAGRHARPLAAAGCRVASLDLSADLLREAHDRGTPGLVRADMRRVPLLSGSFAAAASLFTSFGYFPSEEEDRAVLAEVARVLAPGGRYLLDVMNRERTLTDLVPRSVDRIEGFDLIQERWFDEKRGRIEKSVTLRRPGCATPAASYVESVRVYRPREIEELLTASGLTPLRRFGDFTGEPFEADSSPRLLVLARQER